MISIITLDGTEHSILKAAALESKVIRDTIDAAGDDSTEAIPVAVTDADFLHIASFMAKCHEQSATHPLVSILRPLKKREDLTIDIRDSGVPDWALEFIDSIPMGPRLLDVLEAAQTLKVHKLYYLGCARIASDVGLYSFTELREMCGKFDTLTPAKSQQVKAQNKWSVKAIAESVPFLLDD